ncbi:metallophosphoesterase [Treponema sp.]|uniref:metallophosphoesterase n=1 Tax=Treponema sp. TaxID=166 RepID=UPI0025CBBDC9|nr:metallophosphoesterase [Treponema sp.]MCR5217098.1 metallophosphoesterase [Treponema sp.]
MKVKSFIFFAFTFICLTLSSCRSIHTPAYTIKSPVNNTSEEKDSGLRIVQVSDFHSNDFGKNEEKLLNKIREAKPDLIVFTGDTFDFDRPGIKPIDNVRILLKGIKELCPFYYINGNHEYYNYHNDEYSYIIEEYGGIILRDQAVKINVKGKEIILAGLQDPFADLDIYHREKIYENKTAYEKRIDSVCSQAEKLKGKDTLCSILLAHRPEYIYSYLKGPYKFDLILSGHAHGGQWRFPGINGLYAPMQGLFPEFAGGRYDFDSDNNLIKDKNDKALTEGQVTFIVSRGLSYQCPGIPRILNNPELVIIDIKINN